MTPAEFSLNFLWLDKNIAVAVDQVFNQVGGWVGAAWWVLLGGCWAQADACIMREGQCSAGGDV
jgi:hypothetical protein